MSEFENDPSAAGEENETDETPRNDVVVKIGLVGDAQVIWIAHWNLLLLLKAIDPSFINFLRVI